MHFIHFITGRLLQYSHIPRRLYGQKKRTALFRNLTKRETLPLPTTPIGQSQWCTQFKQSGSGSKGVLEVTIEKCSHSSFPWILYHRPPVLSIMRQSTISRLHVLTIALHTLLRNETAYRIHRGVQQHLLRRTASQMAAFFQKMHLIANTKQMW